MTIVCIDRPNRTKVRKFTATDVGRITCHAIDGGEIREEIIFEINRRCPSMFVCDCKEISTVLIAVLKLLAAVLTFLVAVGLVLNLMIATIRRIPFLRRIPVFRRFIQILETLPALTLETRLLQAEIMAVLKRLPPPPPP